MKPQDLKADAEKSSRKIETDIRSQVPTNYGNLYGQFIESWKKQVDLVSEKFKDCIEEVRMPVVYPTDVPILIVKKHAIVEVIRYLKEEPGFEYQFLADLTATDESTNSTPRFDVIYNLFSQTKLWRIRLKVRVDEGESVPSLTPLWKGADWVEREVFDMFGVHFSGHPDLRRIMMDSRWQGHPLRKDYPLKGYQIFTEPEIIDPKLLE